MHKMQIVDEMKYVHVHCSREGVPSRSCGQFALYGRIALAERTRSLTGRKANFRERSKFAGWFPL
ncbi:hypothetical protein [Paenibacillus lentus]|uniref:Uncharacterized protein n=1 Tax=Paenibacillus lentus TaxID=1338368 RepID=A0A3S8RUA7_9BACL|nr:hypothetical protein [Paenibacillus lentus]AZK46571.1 hypothetical protein EIM92_10750 [Paenibacillus lentus]